LHPIDIGLACCLAFGVYRGYRTGFVLVMMNTIALVAAIVIGFKFLAEASEVINTYLKVGKTILPFVAFAALAAGSYFFLKWFAMVASKTLKSTLLGPVDKTAGALFGLFKMAFLLSSIVLGLDLLGVEMKNYSQEKMVIFPALVKLSPVCLKFLAPLLPFLNKFLRNQQIL
jgi:uncharacterized membrane protein required for colicin V production